MRLIAKVLAGIITGMAGASYVLNGVSSERLGILLIGIVLLILTTKEG